MARTATPAEKLLAWQRRNPRLAGAVFATLLAVSLGLAGTTWQWRKAVDQTQQADAARREALAAKDDSSVFANFLENRVLAACRPVGQGNGLGKDVTLREALVAIEPDIGTQFRGRPHVEALRT